MAIADDGFAVDYFFAVFSHRVSSVGSGIELCQFFYHFPNYLGNFLHGHFCLCFSLFIFPFILCVILTNHFKYCKGTEKSSTQNNVCFMFF